MPAAARHLQHSKAILHSDGHPGVKDMVQRCKHHLKRLQAIPRPLGLVTFSRIMMPP
jgi:hypothetical protein